MGKPPQRRRRRLDTHDSPARLFVATKEATTAGSLDVVSRRYDVLPRPVSVLFFCLITWVWPDSASTSCSMAVASATCFVPLLLLPLLLLLHFRNSPAATMALASLPTSKRGPRTRLPLWSIASIIGAWKKLLDLSTLGKITEACPHHSPCLPCVHACACACACPRTSPFPRRIEHQPRRMQTQHARTHPDECHDSRSAQASNPKGPNDRTRRGLPARLPRPPLSALAATPRLGRAKGALQRPCRSSSLAVRHPSSPVETTPPRLARMRPSHARDSCGPG